MDSLLISIWKSLMIVIVWFSQFVKHIQFRTGHVKPDLDTRYVNISDPRISNGWHVYIKWVACTLPLSTPVP